MPGLLTLLLMGWMGWDVFDFVPSRRFAAWRRGVALSDPSQILPCIGRAERDHRAPWEAEEIPAGTCQGRVGSCHLPSDRHGLMHMHHRPVVVTDMACDA